MVPMNMIPVDDTVEVIEKEGLILDEEAYGRDVRPSFSRILNPPKEFASVEISSSSSDSDSSRSNEGVAFLSARAHTALVDRFKRTSMQEMDPREITRPMTASKDNGNQSQRPKSSALRRSVTADLSPAERPKRAGKASLDHSEDSEEDDTSEFQSNKTAQIEGPRVTINGGRSTYCIEKGDYSSESNSDIMSIGGMEDEELDDYENRIQRMALEALIGDSQPYFPALPRIPALKEEEIRKALIKKKIREEVLDKKREQLGVYARFSINSGIHGCDNWMYQPEDYEGLNTTPEINELFEYITLYSPPAASSQIDVKLKPFIPEFYPSVGDIDAFLKVIHPEIPKDNLGIKVLDEPCAFQSDPSVLDLRLRAMAKQSSARAVVVKKVENVGKNSKVIDNWIKDISDLHRAKPSPSIHYSKPMPDLDQLLQEWPHQLEKLLLTTKLPPPDLDVDLKTYVDIVCNLLDIPIYKSRIQSLHVLASLYLAHKTFLNFNPGVKIGRGKKTYRVDDGDAGSIANGIDRLELD